MLLENTCLSVADAEPIQPIYLKKMKKSLQAHPVSYCLPKRKRASCFASCHGSATVEAALLLPVFLCAVCALIMMGQLLLIEGEIQHAVDKTAMICARQEAARTVSEGKNEAASSFHGSSSSFYSVFQSGNVCDACIVGGRHGILISMSKSPEREGKVNVTAVYTLKIPVPFFRSLHTIRKICATRRIYTGYLPHGGEETGKNDRIVYITEHGSVYHTSLSCTHISLRISGSSLAVKMLEARGIRRCEKCIRKNDIPESLYITAEGDCYHSTVSCSGLKRSVKTVSLSEIKGMRICSRCAAKSGK